MRDKMSMNISVNGHSRVPPGFRFHPTEEELLQYYLRKKVANEEIDLDVIFEVDLNKLEPWDIQEQCKIGSTPQNDWYFFSHKDKKYPTGTRTNRATAAGFWKATGRDKVISHNCKRIGMRKTLVFYKGRAPHGQKSDWIMHEYRLDDNSSFTNESHPSDVMVNGELAQEEGWVVCRIFKKKNHFKTLDTPNNNTTTLSPHSTMINSPNDHDHNNDHDHDYSLSHHHDQGALEQIFQFIGTTKPPHLFNNNNHNNNNSNNNTNNVSFMALPSLESPNNSIENPIMINPETSLADWTALDRFAATHLNGQSSHDDQVELPPLRSSSSTSSSNHKVYHATLDNNYGGSEIDLWSFITKSTLPVDSLCHVSDNGL